VKAHVWSASLGALVVVALLVTCRQGEIIASTSPVSADAMETRILLARAAMDLKCQSTDLAVDSLGRLWPDGYPPEDFFQVHGCGLHARYACIYADSVWFCIREPEGTSTAATSAANSATEQGVVRSRAMVDLGCAAEGVSVEKGIGLSSPGAVAQDLFTAHGCGHDARYACGNISGEWYCSREPLP